MDTVIRGGILVDGTGAPGRRADVGIADGMIAAVGDVDRDGAEVIDADGLVVAPGFIDVHVHYDAQVLWDPALTPSVFHGVTTVLGGNCGFTLAAGRTRARGLSGATAGPGGGDPARDPRRRVSTGPGRTPPATSLRIEGRTGPNVGFLAGHSTIRRAVMGDRCIGGTATDDDLAPWNDVLAQSLAAGALGFSSSNAATHNDGDGDPVPSRFANEVELFRLCRVVAGLPGYHARVHPRQGGRRDGAHGRHVVGGPAAAQLEHPPDRLGSRIGLPGRPGRVRPRRRVRGHRSGRSPCRPGRSNDSTCEPASSSTRCRVGMPSSRCPCPIAWRRSGTRPRATGCSAAPTWPGPGGLS